MKRISRHFPLILLVLILISLQIACGLSPSAVVSDLGSIDCAKKGGVWRQSVNNSGELEEWCDTTVKPTATIKDPETTEECIASKTNYHWSYEDLKSSNGTGGLSCNARLLFTNEGNDPLLLMYYKSWDNNAMKFEGWKSYSLAPGGTHEKRVSRTVYTDGVITFDRVDRMLVLRDLPGCVKDYPSSSQASEWADAAENVDELPCP